MLNVIFAGTPDFAKEALKAIYEKGQVNLVGVMTNPDRPAGRGHKIKMSPVKEYALEKNIPVYQPEKIKTPEFLSLLSEINPDLIIVAAYGKILPEAMLNIPKYGCVNIHASLLPRWRGAAPINRAVMQGDEESGITIMYMAPGLDDGDIIRQKSTKIRPDETAGELHDDLAVTGGEEINAFIADLIAGNVKRTPQDGEKATYAKKITDEDRKINFSVCAKELCDNIRGLSPFPGAYCSFNGKRIKIHKAVPAEGEGNPGEVLGADGEGIKVACKSGAVLFKVLQTEGKSAADAKSWLCGNKAEKGSYFICS